MKPLLRGFCAVAASAAVTMAGVAALTAPAQARANAEVVVVHGIPGATVDVTVTPAGEAPAGKPTLAGFKPKTVTDPLSLAYGKYDVELRAPGTSTPIVAVKNLEIDSANVSVVAHLNAKGEPTVSAFDNNIGKLDAGKSRISVVHAAAAPAVDVRAGGTPVFKNIVNGDQRSADVPVGPIKADVVLAGTDTVAISGIDAVLPARTNTIVYAIGSAENKSLDFVVQTIDGLPTGASEPTTPPVAGGTGGGDSLPVTGSSLTALIGVSVMLVAGGVVALLLYRRRKDPTFIA